jgi:4'-phosphopantetheinyl transferase
MQPLRRPEGAGAAGAAPLRWHSAGEHELPGGEAWLTAREREVAAGLRFTKRRNDYLLGRFTAKSALARALGLSDDALSLQRIDVRNRRSGPERGAPEAFLDGAPADFEISITDRAGWGVCVVRAGGGRVGCDLELVEPRSAGFVADYLTASEQAFVAEAPGEDESWLRANLVWCAKECALKLLRTGLRRDTRSVEVTPARVGASAGWLPLRMAVGDGAVFPGWWRRFGDFVLTVGSQRPLSPPRVLGEPAGLETARPSHRWLERPLVRPATGR